MLTDNFAIKNIFMKKGLIIIGVVIVAVALYFLLFNNEDENKSADVPKMQALVQGKNSELLIQDLMLCLTAIFL